MDKLTLMTMALFGMFVKERIECLDDENVMRVEEIRRLENMAHVQVSLYLDGVRDSRLHDNTLIICLQFNK